MKTVVARYRLEADGAWIATVPDVPGFYAYGDTFDEARDRVQEGLPPFAGEADMLIAHVTGVSLEDSGATTPKVRFGITKDSQPRPTYTHRLSGVSPA